jgi:tricorn protease
MKRSLILFILLFQFLFKLDAQDQILDPILRFPDVSAEKIVFVHGGNLWIVDKAGGAASMLTSARGSESFPKFSPDGQTIAFTANYSGNSDVYTVSSKGGMVNRLTYHLSSDNMRDWSPDGRSILFSSGRNTGRSRFEQFYQIDKNGGMAVQLPIKQASMGSFSPDARSLAFTDRSRLFRTWKRYRGGSAADIHIINLQTLESENITKRNANDELPMWVGDKIYYLSDAGLNKRMNIWVYDLTTKQHRQITDLADHDIQFPSLGKDEIVFTYAEQLYLLDLKTEALRQVEVQMIYDHPFTLKEIKNVKRHASNMRIAPGGERVLVEARGEVFSLPSKEGVVQNLTGTSGTAERFPAWSPDGSKIAYFSDESGEYELVLLDLKTGSKEQLSKFGPGFRYHLFWSPDSEKLAFIDQRMMVGYFDTKTKVYKEIDQAKFKFHGALMGFNLSWSPDSKWLAYSRSVGGRNEAVFMYSLVQSKVVQVTSGFYGDRNPVFDLEGSYLYFMTDRHLSPVYGDFDWSFVYPNASVLAAIPLNSKVEPILYAKNDTVAISLEEEEKEEDVPDLKKDKKKAKKKAKKDEDEEETEEEKKDKDLKIDLDNMESRLILLPVRNGNMNGIMPAEGKVVFNRFSNSGSSESGSSVVYFDLKEREEKVVMSKAFALDMSKDGKKLLVRSESGNVGVISISEGAKMEDNVPLSDMEMFIDVKAEWMQIFTDAWRIERDFFYDEDMHGVDWDEVRVRYGSLIKNATSRWDVNFLLGEMIGELNASHTYRGGGDMESSKRKNMGFLGVDWVIEHNYYKIEKVIRSAPWDVEVKSPLDKLGIELDAGFYVFSVNGRKLDIAFEPYAAFEGLGGKTVEILAGKEADPTKAKKYIVKLLSNERRLRNLAWIESNRNMVDKLSKGKIGYIYVPSTGVDGQTELVRQFNGQVHKEALIIDERFNSGGQIPDRFIEILNRKPVAYWAVRDGKDWQWPPIAHFGPKAMLINGWSGSGGDALPDYFRKNGLGPLIGDRTWGGLIGITGAPALIDGGGVTVPTFRMYHPDGSWFEEGLGVEPDIKVPENPGELARGKDGQIESAVKWLLESLVKNPYAKPERPAKENRN